MPSETTLPALSFDLQLINKVGKKNVEQIFSVWKVFSRCTELLEEGRRLENLSWRLWSRETCCFATNPAGLNYGQNGSIAEDDVNFLFATLRERKELKVLGPITHSYVAPIITQEPKQTETVDITTGAVAVATREPITLNSPSHYSAQSASSQSESDFTTSSIRSTTTAATSVVRGFSPSPSNVITSFQTDKSALIRCIEKPTTPKKQTSFQEEVEICGIQTGHSFGAEISKSDEDDMDENAIDDDDDADSSDWEDVTDDKSLFQRESLLLDLSSRPSLITTMLHQNSYAADLPNSGSRPRRPALRRFRMYAATIISDDAYLKAQKPPLRIAQTQCSKHPSSSLKSIIPTADKTPLSPGTIRQNMLAAELTANLCQQLLWERQHKSLAANLVCKRRQTVCNVVNLAQDTDKVDTHQENNESLGAWWAQSWIELNEYHMKGW